MARRPICPGHSLGPAEAGRPVLVAIALLAAVVGAVCRREAPPPQGEPQETVVPVGAVAAERSTIRAVIHASGVVVPAEGGEFLVFAPEPTRLADVLKTEGDIVTTGDVLARFDLPSATQAIARLAAELAAAEARAERARVNQERVRGFVERGLVARRDLQTADRELSDAQAALERAKTAHAAAQAGATRGIVRAPFDGIVATRMRNPGDVILSTTDPVLRVVDPLRLEVTALIAREDQSRVITGATARIAAAGVDPVSLTVAGRAIDSDTQDDIVPFRLVFERSGAVAVDTPVQLDIDAEERTDAVVVPAEAVIRSGTDAAVFVVQESRAARRVVTTGLEDAVRVEITSGVRAGERVITRGQVGLTDGAAITVAD